MTFAQACADGHAGACTNRAAGILNGEDPAEPLARIPEAARQECTFRTFRQSCAAGDSWGCTMLGSAYQEGDGTPVDRRLAHSAFAKACELAPDFVACDYARKFEREE